MPEEYSGSIKVFKDDPNVGSPARNFVPRPAPDDILPPGIGGKDSQNVRTLYGSPQISTGDFLSSIIEREKLQSIEYHTSLFHTGDLLELTELRQTIQGPRKFYSTLVVLQPAQRSIANNNELMSIFTPMEVEVVKADELSSFHPENVGKPYRLNILGSMSRAGTAAYKITQGEGLVFTVQDNKTPASEFLSNPITAIRVKRRIDDTLREIPREKLAEFQPVGNIERLQKMQETYNEAYRLVQRDLETQLQSLGSNSYYQRHLRLEIQSPHGDTITYLIDQNNKMRPYLRVFDKQNQKLYQFRKINAIRKGETIFQVKVFEGNLQIREDQYGFPQVDSDQSYSYIVSNSDDDLRMLYEMTQRQERSLGLLDRHALPTEFLIDQTEKITQLGDHHGNPNDPLEEEKLSKIVPRFENNRFVLQYGDREDSIAYPPNLEQLDETIKRFSKPVSKKSLNILRILARTFPKTFHKN